MVIDRQAVYRYAQCSRIAYLDQGVARGAALAELGLTVYLETDSAYAAKGLTETVIAFRGTSDLHDLSLDADCLLSGSPLMHDGMRRDYQEQLPWLKDALEVDHPSRVTFTGHSLGASDATEAVMDFADEDMFCYTFGSPRVGCRSFAAEYAARKVPTVRVVHADDLVPCVPGFPFFHVCDALHLNDQGQEIPAPVSWVKALFTDMEQVWENIDGQGLAAHACDKYVSATQLYAKGA